MSPVNTYRKNRYDQRDPGKHCKEAHKKMAVVKMLVYKTSVREVISLPQQRKILT